MSRTGLGVERRGASPRTGEERGRPGPEDGLPRRLGVYFRVMFPLHTAVPAALVIYYSFYLLLVETYGVEAPVRAATLFGLATVFLSMLLWRLLDELKDQAVDPRFFPDRPLVTGRVRYSDIRLLALGSILAVVLLNLSKGPATDVYFVYFVLFVLSWQWWLFPNLIANNVWLVFATHQTLVPVLFFYVWSVFAFNTGLDAEPGKAVALSLIYWIPFFAWEIGRKIRAPDEETEYMTYTKRWGTRRAPVVAAGAILGAGAAMAAFALTEGLGSGLVAFHATGAAAVALVILRFARRPTRRTNRVRQAVEAYVFLFSLGNLVLLIYG
ncbi:MAG: hypothetical protein ACE5O2_03010 [Armatimonadota bacterium]